MLRSYPSRWLVLALAPWALAAQTGIVQDGPKLVGTGAVGLAAQGASVALSADGTTLAVGGYRDDNRGAIWVFKKSSAGWVQDGPKLTASGGVGIPALGVSIAISADGNTVVAGAPSDRQSAGAAWVFTRAGGAWQQQGPKLVGSGGSANANQGKSVAISGDGLTIAVGGYIDAAIPSAVGEPGSYLGTGAVWIFTRSGTTWTQQGEKLVPNDAVVTINNFTGQSVPPAFGVAVALSKDGNTLLGGGMDDNGFTGAAWIFDRVGGKWSQHGPKLVGTGSVSGLSASPHIGNAVALSADGATALLGGYFDNFGRGAAWVFVRKGTAWSQQGPKLLGADAIGNAEQGQSVSLSADGDTAIVGGFEDNSLIGAAWIFSRAGDTWTQRGGKLVGTDPDGVSQQGYSVALSGDGATAAVGGAGDGSVSRNFASGAGAAWMYRIPPVPTLSLAPATVASGFSTVATFRLGAPAPAGGAAIAVTADSRLVSLPATVTISAGLNSTTFPVTTGPVPTRQSVTITATYNGASVRATLTVEPGPYIQSGGVLSAGAFGGFPAIAPGSWIEIYGSGLAAQSRAWTGADFDGPTAPTALDGTTVTIGGQRAFLAYVSPTQINALTPFTIGLGPQNVIVSVNGAAGAPTTVNVAAAQPGLLAPGAFLVDGRQYVAAILSDGSFALPPGALPGTTTRGARAGEIVTLYGVGFGPVTPSTPAGVAATGATAVLAPLRFSLGDAEVSAPYAGLAPNSIGLYQFNLLVPPALEPNAIPVSFLLDGVPGRQKLFLAVE